MNQVCFDGRNQNLVKVEVSTLDIELDINQKYFLKIDVEGFEFELVSLEALEFLKHSTIVIELHPHLFQDGDDKVLNLINMASRYFNINYINPGARNPHTTRELKDFSENDKWLLCSEGRAFSMNWMILNPIEHNKIS
jgi:hypothetical protein